MRDVFILSVNGDTIGVHASLSKLFREIGDPKEHRSYRRYLKDDPILEIGDIKIERTKLIISKRKSTNNGERKSNSKG